MTLPLLKIQGIFKSYGATNALIDVSLDVRAGEVHAIVGENGAGKSTLINVISGNVEPDAGTLAIADLPVKLNSPRAALAQGIATVHQELSIAENLSVAENVFAARVPSRFGFVNWRALRSATRAVFDDLGLSVDPNARAGALPVSARQLAEIAKALTLNAQILLLDEPTSALNADEKNALFSLIGRLKAKGIGIVYISHHLDEVIALADRISVLRDGRLVATHLRAEANSDILVRAMVGRDLSAVSNSRAQSQKDTRLIVTAASRAKAFTDINLKVGRSEIVAIAGLMGSGRSELLASLAGLLPLDHGCFEIDGKSATFSSIIAAKRAGVGYIPAERKTEGLFLDMTVGENVVAASLSKVTRQGRFDHNQTGSIASSHIAALNIRSRGSTERCRALSGGNQQKVLFAKWLETAPSLLLIEEPTKGVDVAAKLDIHRQIIERVQGGASILFASSDLVEMLGLAHRIIVMHQGRIVADLVATETTEQEIAALSSGLVRENERNAA